MSGKQTMIMRRTCTDITRLVKLLYPDQYTSQIENQNQTNVHTYVFTLLGHLSVYDRKSNS